MTRFMTNGMCVLLYCPRAVRHKQQHSPGVSALHLVGAAAAAHRWPRRHAHGGKTKRWRITTTHNVKRARLQLCTSLLKNNRLISYFLSTRRLNVSSWDSAHKCRTRNQLRQICFWSEKPLCGGARNKLPVAMDTFTNPLVTHNCFILLTSEDYICHCVNLLSITTRESYLFILSFNSQAKQTLQYSIQDRMRCWLYPLVLFLIDNSFSIFFLMKSFSIFSSFIIEFLISSEDGSIWLLLAARREKLPHKNKF